MKGNFETIISSDVPVLVDFHAEWCSPCKMQSPIMVDVAKEMGEKVKIIKIDVDRNPEIAGRYNIRSVPTIMLFKNSEVKFQQAGVQNKAKLITLVNPYQ